MDICYDSVVLLCNVLNRLQSNFIDPCYFMKAFSDENTNDLVNVFWLMLHQLMCKTSHVDGYVICTKLCFASRGFKGLALYSLPNDASFGSCELLFAFSWLIANNFIEEKVDDIISEFIQTKKSCMVRQKLAVLERLRIPEERNYLNFPNCILYKAEKTRLAYRCCFESLTERRECLLKLGKYRTDNILSLKLIEVLNRSKLSHHHYLKTALDLESLIESYQLWKNEECSYFLWLDSTLREKLANDRQLLNQSDISKALLMKNILKEEIKRRIPTSENKENNKFIGSTGNHKQFSMIFLKKIETFLRDLNLFVIKQY